MPVVDASVWVSRFLRTDVAHERSKKWFAEAVEKQLTLYAPAVVLPEVAAAIARTSEGPNGDELANEALAVLRASGVKIIDVSLSLGLKAAQIAGQCRVRGCDAVYLALAEQLSEPLVTLDKQQNERGGAVVQTMTP